MKFINYNNIIAFILTSITYFNIYDTILIFINECDLK